MAARKTPKPRRPRRRSDNDLKAIYARVKREFSAADLQKYTRIEKGIPADKVLAELERLQHKFEKRS